MFRLPTFLTGEMRDGLPLKQASDDFFKLSSCFSLFQLVQKADEKLSCILLQANIYGWIKAQYQFLGRYRLFDREGELSKQFLESHKQWVF